jgi:hypothetical protein
LLEASFLACVVVLTCHYRRTLGTAAITSGIQWWSWDQEQAMSNTKISIRSDMWFPYVVLFGSKLMYLYLILYCSPEFFDVNWHHKHHAASPLPTSSYFFLLDTATPFHVVEPGEASFQESSVCITRSMIRALAINFERI